MYKMKVPLSIFSYLKDIADRNNIKHTDWANKSGILNTRISEYVRIAKVEIGIGNIPEDAKKRAFTLDTAIALYGALKNILGEEQMRKDLKKCLESEPDPLKRIIMIAMVKHEEGDKKFIKMAADYLELLFKANNK